MIISNIEGLTVKDIQHEIDRGGKFVLYQYSISILVMSFRRPSNVYFIRGGENATMKGMQFTLLSLVAGWWGIPWGPIYTIQSLATNLGGGKNVTAAILQHLQQQEAAQVAQQRVGVGN